MFEEKIVYLSGPISGLEDVFRARFADAENYYLERGSVVLNPAILPDGLRYEQYMDIDMAMVRACDVLVSLPGWEESKGAKAERFYARCLKKTIIKFSGGSGDA